MAEVFHATAASPTRQDVNVDEGTAILLVGLVLAASIVVALGAARTGLPVLVAFLALGMLLGSDGPGRDRVRRRGARAQRSGSSGSR